MIGSLELLSKRYCMKCGYPPSSQLFTAPFDILAAACEIVSDKNGYKSDGKAAFFRVVTIGFGRQQMLFRLAT